MCAKLILRKVAVAINIVVRGYIVGAPTCAIGELVVSLSWNSLHYIVPTVFYFSIHTFGHSSWQSTLYRRAESAVVHLPGGAETKLLAIDIRYERRP